MANVSPQYNSPNTPVTGGFDSRTKYGPQNKYAHMLNWLLQRRDATLAAPQSTPDRFGASDYGVNPNWHAGTPDAMRPVDNGFEVTHGNEYMDFGHQADALQFIRAQLIANRIRAAHGMQGTANVTPVAPPPQRFTPNEYHDARLMAARPEGAHSRRDKLTEILAAQRLAQQQRNTQSNAAGLAQRGVPGRRNF